MNALNFLTMVTNPAKIDQNINVINSDDCLSQILSHLWGKELISSALAQINTTKNIVSIEILNDDCLKNILLNFRGKDCLTTVQVNHRWQKLVYEIVNTRKNRTIENYRNNFEHYRVTNKTLLPESIPNVPDDCIKFLNFIYENRIDFIKDKVNCIVLETLMLEFNNCQGYEKDIKIICKLLLNDEQIDKKQTIKKVAGIVNNIEPTCIDESRRREICLMIANKLSKEDDVLAFIDNISDPKAGFWTECHFFFSRDLLKTSLLFLHFFL